MEDEVSLVDALVEEGVLEPEEREPALHWLLEAPARAEWAAFLSVAGYALGTGCALAGVLYLVAFNWSELGIYPRLGAVYGGLAAAGGLSIWAGPRTLVGQLAGLSAAVMAGSGLVVYSQVYQSGANPWVLFAAWSFLALPFVLGTRTPPAWALLIVLLDLLLATGVGSLARWEWGDPITLVLAAVATVHLGLAELWRGQWLQIALQLVATTTLVMLGGGQIVEMVIPEIESGTPGGVLSLVGLLVWGFAIQLTFAMQYARLVTALFAWVSLAALATTATTAVCLHHGKALGGLPWNLLPTGFVLFSLSAVGFVWLAALGRRQPQEAA